jgi:hypothetical protein
LIVLDPIAAVSWALLFGSVAAAIWFGVTARRHDAAWSIVVAAGLLYVARPRTRAASRQ